MKKIYKLFLLIALVCSGTLTAQADDLTLTVMDDDWTTTSVPVDGYNLDGPQHNQLLFLSSELSAMDGANIKGLKFYFNRTGHSWSNASNIPNVTFRLAEVENTSITSLVTVDGSFSQVYTGAINFDFTNKEFTVTFDAPYSYNGGNLLIDIQTTAGAYVKTSSSSYMAFYAASVSNRALKGSTIVSYCPKTTFTYEAAPAGSCAKPTNVTATQNTPVKATLSWTKAEGQDNYQYLYVEKNGTPNWEGVEAQNTNSVELDGLTCGVEYDFYVRTYCGTDDQSTAVKKTFSTSCPAPTAPQVTDIATTTATLSWTAAEGITDYQYIVVERGAAEDWTSPTLVEGAVTTSLTSLTAGTKYDVYVRSYFNATTVSSSVKAQFATPCNAMSVEDFDGTFENETAGSGLMPNCWDAVSYEYNSTTYPYVRSGYSAHGGDKWLHFYGGASTSVNIAVLPVFTEALNTLTVSFYYKNYNTYSGQFSFGYYKNGVFTAYEGASNLERKTSYTYFELVVPNVDAAEGARLAIQYAGGSYSYDAYIDDVTVIVTPTCTKPSGVAVSNVLYDGATIDWTENGTAEAWKVQYSTDGENWTTANDGNAVTAHPYNLRGLTTGTPYYVQIISVCSATDESPAVAAASTFTPTCKTPGTPTIPTKTTTTATIQWTVNSGEAEWNLQYKKSSDADWTTVENITENPYLLEGLSSGTTYQVKVAATCNGTYTSAVEFDTECEAKTLPYNEDFNNQTANKMPSCWTAAGNTAAVYVASSSSYLTLSSKALYFTGGSGTEAIAILPDIDADLNTLQVAFSHVEESSTKSGKIRFGYYKDAAFTALKTCDYSTSSSLWRDETAFPITGVPDGAKLAFAYLPVSSAYTAAIDNIAISEYVAPSCPVPADVKTTAVDSTSATITWTNGGEETAWKLRYSKNADMSDLTEVEVASKPHVLEGLDPATKYYVQVAAVCDEENESEWSVAGDFTTDCGAYSLPFSEAFSSSLPNCWRTNAWAPSSSQRVSYSYSMSFSAYYATAEEYGDLVTPFINLGGQESNLTFQLHNYNEVVGELYIVVGSTTTKLMDLPKATAWTKQTVDLTAYVGQTAKFIFRAYGNGGTSYSYIYIDDVAIDVKPCAKPTGLAAAASKGSAIITWTDDEADTWNLRYRIVAEPENEWTLVENLTAKSKELTGLNEENEYEVQIQAVCSATRTSDWTASVKFTPACPTPGAITFSDKTYNGVTVHWTAGGAETAWNLAYQQGEDGWTPVTENPLTTTSYTFTNLETGLPYSFQVQAACEGDWTAEVTYTPQYSVPVASEAENVTDIAATIQWLAVTDASSYEYDFVLPGDEAEWKPTSELTATASNLAAGANYLFVVRSVYPTGHSANDTTEFATITIAPQNLKQVGDATATSASFSWEANGAATQYQWSLDNSTWSEAQSELTATATGLISGSDYTFYVRSYYNADVQSAALSLPFQTACETKALPFTEDFNASTSLPACWVADEQWSVVANTGVGNTNALRLNSSDTADVQTPSIELTEDAILRFSHYSYYVSGAVYINSVDDEHKLIDLSTNSDFAQKTIDLAAYTGQTVTFIFRGNKYQSYRYLYIDNVEVIAKPCPVISTLNADAKLDSVVLTWTSDADAFEYCVVPQNEAAAGWQATDAKTATVKGLTPTVDYTAYVRSSCSETKKGEPKSVNFTPACPAPTALDTVDGTLATTSVSLHWTAAAGITKYQYKLGAEEWSSENVVEGTSVELTGLNPATTYTFYVRSYYSADAQSTAITKSFTTECEAVALPLNEDFSGDITCWTLEHCRNYTGVSSSAFRFYFTTEPSQFLITPELVPTEKNVKVQFDYKAESASNEETFELGYSLTTRDTTSFVWIDTTTTNITEYQEYAWIVPAGTKFIAIKHTSYDKYYLWIDNFKATETSEYPTALDNAGAEGAKATKRLENNMLIIELNGVQYNAQGQLLKK